LVSLPVDLSKPGEQPEFPGQLLRRAKRLRAIGWLLWLARAASGQVARCSLRKSSNRPVTLLVFLSRSAWTWIVAADFRLIAHDGFYFTRFFSRGGRALVWTRKLHATTAARGESTTLDLFG